MAEYNITVTPPPEINIVASPVAVSIQVPSAHTHPQSEITGLVSDLAGKQPLDAILTALAALDLTGNASKFIQVNVGADGFQLSTVEGSGEGGVSDGDKGDIVVSSGGTVWTIDSSVLTTFGRSLIDDADAAAARTTLGLGTAATSASSAFASASHSHTISDTTGLQTALDGKASSSHSHAISDVTNLQTSLDAKAATSHSHAISDVTNLQTTLDGKAASTHTHTISQVIDLQYILYAKSDTGHTHVIADVTGLQDDLDDIGSAITALSGIVDGKADEAHSHPISDVTGLQTALDGKAASSHNHAIGTDITGLGTGAATFLGTPSSANLAAMLTDEIGTGKALFSDPVINAQTGTTYTLQASDNGKIVECSNAGAITVTVPASLGAGFNCVVVQLGAGQVTLSASSTTLRNRNGLKTAGQYAALSIIPTSTADTFIVSGDAEA